MMTKPCNLQKWFSSGELLPKSKSSLSCHQGLASFVASLILLSMPGFAISATTGTLVIAADTTLTEDHGGDVIITESGVILDCANFWIIGPGFDLAPFTGIFINSKANVTVKNCHVTQFTTGFGIYSSDHVVIEDSSSNYNFLDGFQILDTTDSVFRRNRATGNGLFSRFSFSRGFFVQNGFRNQFIDNTAADSGAPVTSTRNGFYVSNTGNAPTLTSNVFTGNLAHGFSGTGFNFGVGPSFGDAYIENTAIDNSNGFRISGSFHTVNDNTAINSSVGFVIMGAFHNLVGNVAEHNVRGFRISGADHWIAGNTASDNDSVGFDFYDALRLEFLDNVVRNNEQSGVRLFETWNSIFEDNWVAENSEGFRVRANSVRNRITKNLIESNLRGIYICRSLITLQIALFPNEVFGPQQAIFIDPNC